jgi:hypothetical protein
MESNYFYQVVSFKEKLIFLTPPKCSTYSLNKFLVDVNITLDEPINYPQHPFYHPTLKEITKAYNIDKLEDYKIIQITRNPYDRFISSYIHEQNLLKKSLDLDYYISQVEQFKYLLPNNINEFYKSFYQTLEYRNFYYKENSWGGLRFYFEQNWWNDLNTNISFFKLEDIKYDSFNLCNLLKRNLISYPQINKLNYSPIYLSKIQKEKIYNIFREDFKIFNYERF